jgi:multidrug resistance protein, MATE family
MSIRSLAVRPGWSARQQQGRSRLGVRARRQAREARHIGALAAPIMVAGGLNVAISLTDTAMMAALDPHALAGGAVVSDLYSLTFYGATGILAAVTPLAAAAIGAGDNKRVGTILAHAMILLAILALAGYWLVAHSVDLLLGYGISIPRSADAAGYAGYMGLAFCFMLIFALGRSTLAALGRGRPPIIILAFAVPLNAVGNYVLMYGAFGAPEMGLAGAGAASLIVAVFAATATIGYAALSSIRRSCALASGFSRFDPRLVLRLAGVGLMIAASALAETGVFLTSTLVVAIVAPEALPAHALVFRALGLSYSAIVGFGQAVTVRVAYAWGAGARHREELARRTGEVMALLLAATFLAAFWMLGPVVAVALAGEAPDASTVAGQAMNMLPYSGLALAALTLGATSTAIMRGRAEVTMPAALTLAGYWLVGFTTILVATQVADRGAEGVWIGLAAGSIAAAAASWAYRNSRERASKAVERKLAPAPAEA